MSTWQRQTIGLNRWKVVLWAWLLTAPLALLQVTPVCKQSLNVEIARQQRCWQVSSLGRVKNTRGDITCGYRHPNGYRIVQIAGKQLCVHRLVAIAFHGFPSSKASMQVNHMDGDCSNNRLDNLEWVTQSQNICHSYADPSRCTGGPSLSKPVMVRSPGSQPWKKFPSITEAAEKLGIPHSTLRKRCKRNAQVNGLEFKFAEPLSVQIAKEQRCWQVSSFGRVKNTRCDISYGHRHPSGYYMVKICGKTLLVHRLVLFAFRGSPCSKASCQGNHVDGDRSNNRLDNLEWVTQSQNIRHSFADPSRATNGPSLSKPVMVRAPGSKTWRTFR